MRCSLREVLAGRYGGVDPGRPKRHTSRHPIRDTRMRLRSLLLGLTLVSAAACDDDDPSGPAGSAAGEYSAIQLTSTIGGVVTDHLSEGATLSIQLLAGGTTTGHLFVPGAGVGTSDLDLDLAGTWDQTGEDVTFDLEADVFLDDVTFVYDDGILRGDETFIDTRVQVTLAHDALLD